MSVVINHKIIGQNIRHAREKQQLSQKQFAAYLGVSSSYAGRIERGVNKLNISRLYDVSLVLHTPMSELLCGCCPQAALGEEEAFQKNHTVKRLLEILRTASPNAAETMLALCEHLADFDAKKS